MNFGGNGTLSGLITILISFPSISRLTTTRRNSELRSLFNDGGFDFTSNIFAGSHFPGSVGFSRSWDSQGSFDLPDFRTIQPAAMAKGSTSVGVRSAELPSLTATFSDGHGDYSIPGIDEHGNNTYRNFTLRSGYQIAGFNLSAGYNLGSSESNIPLVFGTQTVEHVHSDNDSFTFSASHRLPMHGTFGSSFTRSNINADYLGSSYNGTVDTLNANAGVNPTQKLNLSVGMNYTDSPGHFSVSSARQREWATTRGRWPVSTVSAVVQRVFPERYAPLCGSPRPADAGGCATAPADLPGKQLWREHLRWRPDLLDCGSGRVLQRLRERHGQ